MNIIGRRRFWLLFSAILLVACITAIVVRGFNLGIDFTGGTNVSVPLSRAVTASEAAEALSSPELADLGLESAVIQPFSRLDERGRSHNGLLVKTRLVDGRFLDDSEVDRIVNRLQSSFGEIDRSALAVEKVGPIIGRDMTRNAMVAVLLASVLMLGYISFRFEFKSGVAAVLALVHDVLVVMGIFAMLGREINSTFIAAVLTVIGYSVNDTIVVFDRIRENLQFRKKGEAFETLVNDSIIQTLRRTVNTGMAAIFAVTILFLFGGQSLKEFTLAMLIGMISGTYSSIFVASPIWVIWRNFSERRAATRRNLAAAR